MPLLQSAVMNPKVVRLGSHLNLPLEHIVEVEPREMPERERHLLVHDRDMTGRLARYYQSDIHLQTLKAVRVDDLLYRRVLLETETSDVVEFGAICIHLERFSGQALESVLACHEPLGGILTSNDIRFQCALQGFFRIRSDYGFDEMFELDSSGDLYGRANRLETPEGEIIAEVVEILPP